jgi:hypothetical protein
MLPALLAGGSFWTAILVPFENAADRPNGRIIKTIVKTYLSNYFPGIGSSLPPITDFFRRVQRMEGDGRLILGGR